MGSIISFSRKIVNQAVDSRLLDVLPILTGIVQTLPTSFEKLIITVHPETFERIQAKEYWLLQLVEWKYDFSCSLVNLFWKKRKSSLNLNLHLYLRNFVRNGKKRSYLRSKMYEPPVNE